MFRESAARPTATVDYTIYVFANEMIALGWAKHEAGWIIKPLRPDHVPDATHSVWATENEAIDSHIVRKAFGGKSLAEMVPITNNELKDARLTDLELQKIRERSDAAMQPAFHNIKAPGFAATPPLTSPTHSGRGSGKTYLQYVRNCERQGIEPISYDAMMGDEEPPFTDMALPQHTKRVSAVRTTPEQPPRGVAFGVMPVMPAETLPYQSQGGQGDYVTPELMAKEILDDAEYGPEHDVPIAPVTQCVVLFMGSAFNVTFFLKPLFFARFKDCFINHVPQMKESDINAEEERQAALMVQIYLPCNNDYVDQPITQEQALVAIRGGADLVICGFIG